MLRVSELGEIPEETARAARAALPKGNLALWLRDDLAGLYRDAAFAALYAREGQPALAPWRLAVVTVLQFAEGLTDRQAAEAVRVRLDWKYALGLALADAGFDASVLSEFRERLVATGQAELLLAPLLGRCRERGWLGGGGRARTDSTHVLAAIRRLNRLQVVGETMRQALGRLAAAAPDWLRGQITPDAAERYGRRFDLGRLPRKPADQEALAARIGADGVALLQALADPAAPAGLAMLPAVVTLRLVWLQQYYAPDGGGRVRWRAAADLPPAAVAIHSPYDVEARYSHKRDTVWVGYKAHFTETCDPGRPHLITHVATTPGTTADSDVTARVHRDLAARGLAPAEHLVDEGYTDAALLVSSRERGIDLVGPVRQDHSRQAREQAGYDLTRFTIRWADRRVVCPNGRTSAAWSPAVNADEEPVVRVAFARSDCRACPVRAACTTAADGPRRLTLRPQAEHEALQAARQRQATTAFQTAYARRAGVEGTIAQAVGAGGARRTRFRGLAKTHLQAVATAVAINLHRLWDWTQEPTPVQPRRSLLAALWPCPEPAGT